MDDALLWFIAIAMSIALLRIWIAAARIASGLRALTSGEKPSSGGGSRLKTSMPKDPRALLDGGGLRDESTVRALRCKTPLSQTARAHALDAVDSCAVPFWETILLRDGPDYKRNQIKKPTASPLLQTVGVDVFRTASKIFTRMNAAHAAYLPPEVLEAAKSGPAAPALPRFLVVSINMPAYTGAASDGPGYKYVVHLAVPPELKNDGSAAAALLREFLSGAAGGHGVKGGRFFDRFKVIGRLLPNGMTRELFESDFFLRRMLEAFNGKPMLWRWFGVWGDCERVGGVVNLNLDFCTGGRIKNRAFARGMPAGEGKALWDLSFTLEARDDAEMPERLIGGATFCRVHTAAMPTLAEDAGGAVRLQTGDSWAW